MERIDGGGWEGERPLQHVEGPRPWHSLVPGRSAHLTLGHLPSPPGGCVMAPKSTQQLPPTPRPSNFLFSSFLLWFIPGPLSGRPRAVLAPSGGLLVPAGDSPSGDSLVLVLCQAGGSHGRLALTCFRHTGRTRPLP